MERCGVASKRGYKNYYIDLKDLTLSSGDGCEGNWMFPLVDDRN